MPKPQRRFTQDFRDEAVRLAETSGRTGPRLPGISGSACRPCTTGSIAAGGSGRVDAGGVPDAGLRLQPQGFPRSDPSQARARFEHGCTWTRLQPQKGTWSKKAKQRCCHPSRKQPPVPEAAMTSFQPAFSCFPVLKRDRDMARPWTGPSPRPILPSYVEEEAAGR